MHITLEVEELSSKFMDAVKARQTRELANELKADVVTASTEPTATGGTSHALLGFEYNGLPVDLMVKLAQRDFYILGYENLFADQQARTNNTSAKMRITNDASRSVYPKPAGL